MTTNNDLAEQIEPSVRAHIVAIRTTAAVERAFAATSTAAGGSAQQRTKVANATAMAAPAPRRRVVALAETFYAAWRRSAGES